MDRKRSRPGGSSEYNAQGYRRDVITGKGLAQFSYYKPTKRTYGNGLDEDSYFEDDDDNDIKQQEILAACPFLSDDEKETAISKANEEEEEDDPLDAFMAGIESEVSKQETKQSSKSKKAQEPKGVREDLEDLDSEEQYYKFVKENPDAGKIFFDEDELVNYDEEGNPIKPDPALSKKNIDPLPVIYHSDIEYPSFDKNFYTEHLEIRNLSEATVADLRHKLNIKVSGFYPPKPVSSFGHLGFDDQLMSAIRKQEYTQPTSIQAQGIPCALSGRDMIGIAKTGSGKTAAFVWPMLVHIMDQPEIKKGDGPVGVIIAPTRELCQQIHAECRKFGKVYGLRSVCCFGGGNMHDQQRGLSEGCEIIVATPGRLIDHVKKGNTNLLRTTYLVFDEADRMFEMGFEYQVRSIANHIRPDRQTLLFSATFKWRIERLARDILTDPVRVIQGDLGEANSDVKQIVEIFKMQELKWKWLKRKVVPLTSEGSLLVFVTRKLNAEELATNMTNEGYDVALIHGDMNQFSRNEVINRFKKQQVAILVATDVAARGLDIPHIRNVINYDVARDIDTHTHRIGRTGRAGQKGTAYTLMTNKDSYFAGDLVRNLESANQDVPGQLLTLALQNGKFQKSRYKHKDGKKTSFSTRDRPGLGSESGSSSKKPPPRTAASFRSGGVMGGRASSVKDYFRNQYTSNFVKSTDSRNDGTWNTGSGQGGFKLPTSEIPAKKKKKSRWDTS